MKGPCRAKERMASLTEGRVGEEKNMDENQALLIAMFWEGDSNGYESAERLF